MRAAGRGRRARGYAYLAITDHSPLLAMAHGLDARRLGRQIDAIGRLNAGFSGFTLLGSIEVDIREDGSLDPPDEVLRRPDLVVAAVHSRFKLPRAQQTQRILRAMDNRLVNIVAHPTGRLINQRPADDVDVEQIMRGAAACGCHLELNAQPDRLDVADTHCRMAKAMGVKVAISSDAHATGQLDLIRFGIDQARRGWLEPGDVLNRREPGAPRRDGRRGWAARLGAGSGAGVARRRCGGGRWQRVSFRPGNLWPGVCRPAAAPPPDRRGGAGARTSRRPRRTRVR